MYKFVTLRCYHCQSVILNLPEAEITKLNGLNFQCECCGHQNLLEKFRFNKGSDGDPFLNIFSCESLQAL